MMSSRRFWASLVLWAGLSACGGGGGDDAPPLASDPASWRSGVFPASSNFDAECAAPRSGNDPDGNRWPDVRGSANDEKMWLRSWTHELYLWYREVPDVNPASYSVLDYFDILKTSDTTTSGNEKDRFHFTYPTDQWIALSQSGVIAGYGLQWAVIADTPPRTIVVAYTDPGEAAAVAGIRRGWKVLTVDGVSIDSNTEAGVDTLNGGLFADTIGQQHDFVFADLNGNTHEVTLTTAEITSTPVQNVHTIQTANGLVGYMLFNDHIATAEAQLVAAIETLSNDGINDLVIDIRYNGGGYLAIASQLAYMIAGQKATGKTFEKLQFNDQHPTTDPVTGQPLAPLPFIDTTQDFSLAPGQALPTLNLSRVFVLTGPDTCSASESIINSLRGIDVEVIQIGSTTCGKPYGFYPADNCGTTYFSIQFRGVNAKNFGEYPDGFSPANTTGDTGVEVPGCSVADDFTHELGNSNEGRLAIALDYRLSGNCSVPPSGFAKVAPMSATGSPALSSADGITYKSPWHENRVLRRRH